jgi:hypothetical protein
MPRKPRLFVSEATYHVYSRVARGEFAFDMGATLRIDSLFMGATFTIVEL